MKKKMLIISHAMELGGVERSLLGLLNSIDYDSYEVDLFLLRHEGELLRFIPSEVHLLPAIPPYTVLARPMSATLREGHFLLTASRLAGRTAAQIYAKMHHHKESIVALEYSHKYTKWLMPKIQPLVEYDMAVSFLIPHYFVAEKVRAKKKVAWIHTDYTKVEIDRRSELKMWEKMDWIASISETVSISFSDVFTSLKEKILLIENILPEKLIRYQADEQNVSHEITNEDSIRLLTIGRFMHAKNMDEIPRICSLIRKTGLHIKWYLIGYGGEESLIREKIAEAQMEDYVIILGKKDNPYPYIKACDVYVQPSRYEGKCVAVREAQMLGKPVIITNYATSSSQLEDGVDGVIVPMETEACAAGMADVLRDRELIYRLHRNCLERDFSNAGEVEKLYRLME